MPDETPMECNLCGQQPCVCGVRRYHEQEREPESVRWAREVVGDGDLVFAMEESDMREMLAHIDHLTRELREARAMAEGAEHQRAVAAARLARFEALAREAAQPKLGSASTVGYQCAELCDRLAALAGPEGAPAQPFEESSASLLARLDTLTPDELRATVRDILGERDVLAREVLLLRKETA